MFDLDEITDDVKAARFAIFWRGQFIHRYGGIEFAVCELIARARLLACYSEIQSLPFKWSSKVRACRQLLTLAWPIKEHFSQLSNLPDDLPQFEVYRHLLVHGLMTAKFDGERTEVRMKSYDHVDGEVGLVSLDIPLSQLITLCDLLAPVSTGFSGTVAQICRDVPLPLLSGDAPKPHA